MNFNAGEDTFFQVKKTLSCRGKLLDLSTPAVMGIINVTPDSFYNGGKFTSESKLLSLAESMLNSGADILDIGGQSTRPKSVRISEKEEWNRIKPAINQILKNFPETIISVDTFYSEVAYNSLQEGAAIINDISGGEYDIKMHSIVAKYQVPYILMHMQGTPETMQENPSYNDVVKEILDFFIKKVTHLRELGLHDIIIDPGFGFGKSVSHNFSILRNLQLFKALNCPILAGLSRKSMITKTLNINPENALNGTASANMIALMNGASILRVHDVAEAIQVRKIYKACYN